MPLTSRELLDRVNDYSARNTPAQKYFLTRHGEYQFPNDLCPHNRTLGRGFLECRLMTESAKIQKEIDEKTKETQ